jgi:hypothetical protein
MVFWLQGITALAYPIYYRNIIVILGVILKEYVVLIITCVRRCHLK